MLVGIDASRAVSPLWGGPENYSYYLIQALARVDFRSRYRLYVNAHPPRRLVEQPNFEVKFLPWPRLFTQFGLALECLRHPPDVLFIPAHTIPIIRRPRLRTVVTIHDLAAQYLEQFYQFPGRLYLNAATEYCAQHATRLIAVSESTKRDLVGKLGVSPDSISVVYNGYDKANFYPASAGEITAVLERYNLPDTYLLGVGTVQPRKNYTRLISAFSRFSIDDAKLVIVGKRGWLCDEIYAAPERYGVADRVVFLGHVPDEDLPGLYSGARALIFPSLYEGFGLAPLEAMACGCPVVLANTSSLPEVGGQAAIYADPYDVSSIAQGMAEVLSFTPEQRKEAINRGFDQAAKFSWERSARETIAVFDQVLNQT